MKTVKEVLTYAAGFILANMILIGGAMAWNAINKPAEDKAAGGASDTPPESKA